MGSRFESLKSKIPLLGDVGEIASLLEIFVLHRHEESFLANVVYLPVIVIPFCHRCDLKCTFLLLVFTLHRTGSLLDGLASKNDIHPKWITSFAVDFLSGRLHDHKSSQMDFGEFSLHACTFDFIAHSELEFRACNFPKHWMWTNNKIMFLCSCSNIILIGWPSMFIEFINSLWKLNMTVFSVYSKS